MKKNFGSVTAGNKADFYKKLLFPGICLIPFVKSEEKTSLLVDVCPSRELCMVEKNLNTDSSCCLAMKSLSFNQSTTSWKVISIEILIWPHLCEIPMCCKMDLKRILRDHLHHSSWTDIILRSATFSLCAVTKAGQIFPATMQKKTPARFWSSLKW